MNINYPNTNLFINGEWKTGHGKETIEVINPATEEIIGNVACAKTNDLDQSNFRYLVCYQIKKIYV